MTTFDVDDTIVAVASPPGGALRGIIRISGPKTVDCLRPICLDENEQPVLDSTIKSRIAIPCELTIHEGTRLPGRLLIWPDKRSYTRQPSAEFHTIGSPPLLELATEAICRSGARLAERGEFTLRAFLSGRIDLTQAEAVLAVIDSDNQAQFKNALAQLSGGLAGPLTQIRETLIAVLAELEAGLDFVEEDIEFITTEELNDRLEEARQMLCDLNAQIRSRNLAHDVFTVAFVGNPNAGKSSLFNVLADHDRAIVANFEGTTRDFVTADVKWNDLEVRLIDTAGIESEVSRLSEIESQAQRHTHERLNQAELLLVCLPAIQLKDDLEAYSSWLEQLKGREPILVITKSDLGPSPTELNSVIQNHFSSVDVLHVISTSSHSKLGIDELKNAIVDRAKQRRNTSSFVSSTATRAATSLESAENAIQIAQQAAHEEIGLEIVAAELRRTLHELGTVVGAVYTDDILDRIFNQFCIGK